MGTMTLKGFEDYEAMIMQCFKDTEKIAGRVTYAGAKVIADEIKKGINGIPIEHGFGTPHHPLTGITGTQKLGLIEGFGISKLQNTNGFYNVKIGFDGYNTVETDTWPNGQSNILVARGVESGASWRRKHPFVRPAVNRARARAVKEMQAVVDEEFKKRAK